MNLWSFIVGTAILWLLTGVVVIPLAKLLTKNRANKSVQSYEGGQEAIAQTEAEPEISTGYYILVHVLVLGIAGLIIGLVSGWFFIGITWQAKSWPGMIALIVASIAGAMIHG